MLLQVFIYIDLIKGIHIVPDAWELVYKHQVFFSDFLINSKNNTNQYNHYLSFKNKELKHRVES